MPVRESTAAVVLVTGGASGIGHACVERLVRDGRRVLFTDHSAVAGEAACVSIGAAADRPLFVAGDVPDPAHLKEAATRALDAWGRIDGLVANAGVQTDGTLLATSDDV